MNQIQPPQIIAHCPLCQAAYDNASVSLLGEQGVSRMFHLTCHACRHAVLAVISESREGVSSVGLVTDLKAQDAERIRRAPAITADDCIAAHEVLESRSREVVEALLPGNRS